MLQRPSWPRTLRDHWGDIVMAPNGTPSEAEISAFIKSWKDELEIREKEIYQNYLSGAVGGVLTVVVTVGLAIDKLASFGWFERSILGATLIFLILAAGNILNCTTYATNARLELLGLERTLILNGPQALPAGGLVNLDTNLASGLSQRQQYFRYTYIFTVLAVCMGVIAFFVLLVKA